MEQRHERRRRPRINLDQEAMITVEGTRYPCRTLDITTQGVALLCPVGRLQGENRVAVELQLPGRGWIILGARVVRIRQQRCCSIWGLVLEYTDQKIRDQIECYVLQQMLMNSRKPKAESAPPEEPTQRLEPRSRKVYSLEMLFRLAVDDLFGENK